MNEPIFDLGFTIYEGVEVRGFNEGRVASANSLFIEGRRSRVGRFLCFRTHYCAKLAHRHSWILRVAPSH
jgi:hypothetical protein